MAVSDYKEAAIFVFFITVFNIIQVIHRDGLIIYKQEFPDFEKVNRSLSISYIFAR